MEPTIVYAGARVAGEQGLAVRWGRIAAVGDPVLLRRRFPDSILRTVRGVFLPAALDGHLHLVEYGLSLGEVDLRGQDAEAALARLAAARREAGAGGFVRGRGARPAVLSAIAAQADELAKMGPLRVWAQDFHTALADPETVRRLGLDRDCPLGGEVVRDSRGRITGILKEAAARPLADAAAPGDAERTRAARRAIQSLLRQGIVGAVSFEEAKGEAAVAQATDELPFRAFLYRYAQGLEADETPRTLGRRAVRVGAKHFMDGTLGSRTAWMHAPYADVPSTGMPQIDPDTEREGMRRLAQRGFSLSLHAIGDRAADAALELLTQLPPGDAPHRIEHLQVVGEGFVQAIAATGVTASVQPCHLEQDLEEARRAWADRLSLAYPYRALQEAGAVLAFGSDAPVEEPSLRLGLRWATGADAVGGGVRHSITPEQAWTAYTDGVCRSVGRRGGSIAPGEPANLALYDRGPLEDAGPTLVLSEGVLAYCAEGAYHEEEAPGSGR